MAPPRRLACGLAAALLLAGPARASAHAARTTAAPDVPLDSDVRAFVLVGPTVRGAAAAPSEAWGHPEFNTPLGLQLPISRQFCQLVRVGLAVPDGGSADHLVPFCFPDRLPAPDRQNGGLSTYLHTFACERPDGRIDHAACLTTAFPNPQAGAGAWTPVCLLVASTHPLYRVCSLFLQQVAEEHARSGQLLPAGALLRAQLVRLVSALTDLSARTEALFADGLHPRLPLLPLLRALRWQTDTLVRLWLTALLDGRLLIGSADAAARNVAVHGVQTLLLPFDCAGFVLPMVPTADGGADYAPFLCHSPTPYLVGCGAEMLRSVRASAPDVATLDLDAPGGGASFAPAADAAALHAQLMCTPPLVRLRALLRLHASSERALDEWEVRAAFLSAGLALADPLSDDGALGGSASALDRAAVRHWRLLSGCANVLQRRVGRLCAATGVRLHEDELASAFRRAKLGCLPHACLAELQRAGGAAAASVVEGTLSAHALPLVAEVCASATFQNLHAGGPAEDERAGAAQRCGQPAWRRTSSWARGHGAVYVRLKERAVALQLLSHQLLTHVLRCGVRIRLPAGTWVPLKRSGRTAGMEAVEAAGGAGEVEEGAEQVTDSSVADFQRRFAVREVPVAEYDCALSVGSQAAAVRLARAPAAAWPHSVACALHVCGRALRRVWLTSPPAGAALPSLPARPPPQSIGRLYVTSDSLCHLSGSGQLTRLPLVEVRQVQKTVGGRFAPRGIVVHTAAGARRAAEPRARRWAASRPSRPLRRPARPRALSAERSPPASSAALLAPRAQAACSRSPRCPAAGRSARSRLCSTCRRKRSGERSSCSSSSSRQPPRGLRRREGIPRRVPASRQMGCRRLLASSRLQRMSHHHNDDDARATAMYALMKG